MHHRGNFLHVIDFLARSSFPGLTFERILAWEDLRRGNSVSSVLDYEETLFAVNFGSNHLIYFWGYIQKHAAKYTNKIKRTIPFLSDTRHMCAKFLRQIRPLIIRIIYEIILIM